MKPKMLSVRTMGSISRCDIRGCKGEGLWRPVVTVDYSGDKKAEATVQVHICGHHRDTLGSNFFTSVVLDEMTRQFRSSGIEPPPDSCYKVRWEKWNPGIITVN